MIHPLAYVEPGAEVSTSADIWAWAQVRQGAVIGSSTTVGARAYIDKGVWIGARCKIQNGAQVYHPARVGFGAFIGPNALLINDRYPRAVDEEGAKLTDADWEPLGVEIGNGASIGAGAIIMPGVTVGDHAMVGAGSVVTRDVPAHGKVMGNPARLVEDFDEDDPGFQMEGVGGE